MQFNLYTEIVFQNKKIYTHADLLECTYKGT